jgi:Mg-chelatase subunit ChlD
MTSNFASLRTALDRLNRHGSTNLDIGLAAGTRMLDEDKLTNEGNGIQRAIILFSEGQGIYTPSDIITSPSHQIKEKLYKVFPVGFNVKPRSSQENILTDIANSSGGKYFSLIGIRDVNITASAIIQTLRDHL